MSAKHRRPFFVFAAVAVICSMVLITNVHSKAEDARAQRDKAGQAAASGQIISKFPGTPGPETPGTGPGTDADPPPGSTDEPGASTPGGFGTEPVGGTGNASPEADSGVRDMPPFTVPTDLFDPFPDPDEESGTSEDDAKSNGANARAGHGKNGKDDKSEDEGGKDDDETDEGDENDEDDEDEVPVDGLPSQSADEVGVPAGDE